MQTDNNYLYKILLVGDSSVGKSSILLRFCDRVFNTSYISTIGVDFKISSLQVPYPSEDNKTNVKLQVWDTAGQEKFRTICQTYYRGAHGIMVVYDVTRRDSFDSIQNWLSDVNAYAGVEVSKLLVGTKSDKKSEREVTTEEGENLAEKLGLNFIETSALSGDNIEQAFVRLTVDIMKKTVQNQQPADKGPNTIAPQFTDPTTQKKGGCC